MVNADIGKILSKFKEFNDAATGDGLHLFENQFQQINELVNGNINNLETKLNLLFQLLRWPTGMSTKYFQNLSIIQHLCLFLFL